MLNLSSLSTQSLASCVNYFVWNCLTCFSNTKIGSVTSFSILFNFQGPAAPQPCGWRLDYFITEVIFCQALFSKFFVIRISPANLERSRFLGAGRNFRTSIGSFRFTSSRDLEVILLSRRLALKYNTIRRAGCQHFFCKFFQVFSCWLKSASSSWILQAKSFVFYNVLYKGAQYRQWPLLPCGKHYFLCADCQEVSSQILFRKFSSIFGESYKTQNVVVLPLTYH